MGRTTMGRTTRAAVAAALAIAALAGCAQPGQLGQPAPTATAAAPTGEAAPLAAQDRAVEEPDLPMLLGTGLLEGPVELETAGPAEYSVRTVIIPPGVDVGWHRHPGAETVIVTAGEVTVLREDECEPRTHGTGQAVFVPDAVPHVLRNDGDVTAELVVTYLLTPGQPDQLTAPDACADDG